MDVPSPGWQRGVPDELLAPIASRLLAAVTRLYRRWLDSEIDADWGLTSPRVVLMAIVWREGRISMSRAAAILDVTPRAVTRLVDGLVADGLLQRERRPDDHRVVDISCTPLGSERAAELIPRHEEKMAQLFAGMPEEELRNMLAVLAPLEETLRAALHLERPPAPPPFPPLGPPPGLPEAGVHDSGVDRREGDEPPGADDRAVLRAFGDDLAQGVAADDHQFGGGADTDAVRGKPHRASGTD
jgi:DNA-binding MarR family transcriptional regulator